MNKQLMIDVGFGKKVTDEILQYCWDRLIKFFGSEEKLQSFLKEKKKELQEKTKDKKK